MEKTKKIRVLVVDDNPIIRFAHRHLLRNLGCEVIEANDGCEALQYIKHQFDLILTDIHMPNMDGIQLAQAVSTQDNYIPVVTISTNYNEEERKASLAAGAMEVITKPLTKDNLNRLIKNCCS